MPVNYEHFSTRCEFDINLFGQTTTLRDSDTFSNSA